jgi:hypothetical protein
LESILQSAFAQLGLKPESQTFQELVQAKTDAAVQDLLRHAADEFPRQASEMARYFEEMKKRTSE